jgi:hypothetical protein
LLNDERNALRIISRFKQGDDAIVPSGRPADGANTMAWFWPKFVRKRGRTDAPGQAVRRCACGLSHAPDRRTEALLEIALEVRRARDKSGLRGGPALAELRFLGVVSTKLRAEVLPRGRAPKFNVAVTRTERLSAEHAATRAAVDEIPAAREHRSLPAK